MQTKLYGKSRNGVSFDRLACNRQKETLFLMPYYWDMKGWRATVSCRLDCAIKNGTASCGYKSQPQRRLGAVGLLKSTSLRVFSNFRIFEISRFRLVDLLACWLWGKKESRWARGLAGIALCRLDWRNDYMLSIAFFTSSNTASGPPVPSIMWRRPFLA